MIGRFLEFSVHAPDVLESIAFYERLGFEQATAGDAWPYPYAVMTDGRIGIGLHGRELPRSPMLSFVQPDLFHRLGALEERGIEIIDRRLGGDVFNEASFEAPGGHLVRLLEARTYSPVVRAPGARSRLGWFEEIALPVGDVPGAVRFWERFGFVPAEEVAEPYAHVGLTSDTVDIALLQPGSLKHATLLFSDEEMGKRIEALRDRGVEFARRTPGMAESDGQALLVAPEGTQILLATGE